MSRRKADVSHGAAIPTVACINRSTVDLGVDFDALIAALQKFLDEEFVPVWGRAAKLVKAAKPRNDRWTMVFLDDAKHAVVLGLHQLSHHGLPLAKVFVQKAIENQEKVSVVAAHELVEMLVDPGNNLWCKGPRGTMYAYEACDAVEEEEFLVDGIAMSNFVYPAYFKASRIAGSPRLDHLNRVTRPFEILKGGYSVIQKRGKTIIKHGSPAKRRRFKVEDRRLHRSEYR